MILVVVVVVAVVVVVVVVAQVVSVVVLVVVPVVVLVAQQLQNCKLSPCAEHAFPCPVQTVQRMIGGLILLN